MAKLVGKPNIRKVELADLEDFPSNGIHHHVMTLACFCKGRGADQSDAIELIRGKFSQRPQRRQLQPNEVESAVGKAYSSPVLCSRTRSGLILPPKFEKTSPESVWNTKMPLPIKQANQMAVKRAVQEASWTLDDMWEESPLRVDEATPAELLSMLFDPADLVCCGSVNRFSTFPSPEWLGGHWMGDQVVPNPCRTRLGVTLSKEGKLSAHSRDATGRRKYLIVESDDEDMSFDEKASVLRYLRDHTGATLRMVVHSAGKSLHGWFKADPDESANWAFMEFACLLGADRRMWLPEQLARLPNAVRIKNSLVQKTYYFDPS